MRRMHSRASALLKPTVRTALHCRGAICLYSLRAEAPYPCYGLTARPPESTRGLAAIARFMLGAERDRSAWSPTATTPRAVQQTAPAPAAPTLPLPILELFVSHLTCGAS